MASRLARFGRDEHARCSALDCIDWALAGLLVTLPLYGGFQGTAAMQFVEKAVWIERFNITTTWALMAFRFGSYP